MTYDIFKQLNLFPEQGLQAAIMENCHLQTFEKGDVLVREGQFVKILPIVVSGLVRVHQAKVDREILLYYVEPSQTCMMSLTACFFNTESPSRAVAIEETEAITIPARFITVWQKEYPSWNNFVIKTFKSRYDELLSSFESVAFDNIDKRVLEYLHTRASKQSSRHVEISHQQLANELGTTRVVVSRILKQFEQDNTLKLHRRSIQMM